MMSNVLFSAQSPLEVASRRICFASAFLLGLLAVISTSTRHPLAIVLAGVSLFFAAGLLFISRSGTRTTRIRAALMAASLVLVLTGGEILLRVFTIYPVHGNSNVIRDTDLGYRLDPELPDADRNGFRNPESLESAQIVCLGDSHTQGFNVDSQDSWPAKVGRLLNKSVYNLGIGGYGPLQYQKLLPRALAMNPEFVIVAIYLPNDLSDIAEGIAPRLAEPLRLRNAGYVLRDRTAVGSLIWQTVRRLGLDSPQGIRVKGTANPTLIDRRSLAMISEAQDLDRPEIAAAFRTTFEMLVEAEVKCRLQGVQLVVLMIPSRERVYCESLGEQLVGGSPELRVLLERELAVASALQNLLTEKHIVHADATPRLVERLSSTKHLYPSWSDGHPLQAGYTVYAETVLSAVTSARRNPQTAQRDNALDTN